MKQLNRLDLLSIIADNTECDILQNGAYKNAKEGYTDLLIEMESLVDHTDSMQEVLQMIYTQIKLDESIYELSLKLRTKCISQILQLLDIATICDKMVFIDEQQEYDIDKELEKLNISKEQMQKWINLVCGAKNE